MLPFLVVLLDTDIIILGRKSTLKNPSLPPERGKSHGLETVRKK
jgi:hypothetical protein